MRKRPRQPESIIGPHGFRLQRSRQQPGKEISLPSPVLGYTSIWVSNHAIQRMRQRGISENMLISTLISPDDTQGRTQLSRTRYRKKIVRREYIDVVFEIIARELIVITAIRSQT